VIAPSINADDLAIRLGRLPARLRAALARELDRLARDARLSVSIDTTADTVTAAIRTAGVPPAFAPTPTLRRPLRNPPPRAGEGRVGAKRGREVSAAIGWGLPRRSRLAEMSPEIRAGLEAAARQVFGE